MILKLSKKLMALFIMFLGLFLMGTLNVNTVKADDTVYLRQLIDGQLPKDCIETKPVELWETRQKASDSGNYSDAKYLNMKFSMYADNVTSGPYHPHAIIPDDPFVSLTSLLKDQTGNTYELAKDYTSLSYDTSDGKNLLYISPDPANEVNKFYVRLTSIKTNVHFYDYDEKKEIGTSQNVQVVVDDKSELDPLHESTIIPDPYMKINPLEFPEGYVYDVNRPTTYKVGESTKDVRINVVKVKPLHVSVVRNVTEKGTGKQAKANVNNYTIAPNKPFCDVIKDLNDSTSLNKEYAGNLKLSSMEEGFKNGEISEGPESTDDFSEAVGVFKNFWTTSNPEFNGGTFTFIFNYDYENPNPTDKEYEAKVTIPSNLATNLVPTVSAKGQLWDEVKVDVPTVSGYTADKKTVTATVNADGTITTDDKVTYTKTGNSGGGSYHSSGDHHEDADNNPIISNLASSINIAANKNAVLYDNDGNKLNETVTDDKTFVADKKMIKQDQTYYQIADNKWIKADDTVSIQGN